MWVLKLCYSILNIGLYDIVYYISRFILEFVISFNVCVFKCSECIGKFLFGNV